MRWLGLTAIILALAAGLAWSVRMMHLRAELDRAAGELDRGRYVSARERLVLLSQRRPDHPEVWFRLGLCEHALGRPDEALAAWSRVSATSSWAEPTALHAGKLAMERGRFAEAETILTAALQRPGPKIADVRALLFQLYWHQDRHDEVRPLIQANWQDQVAADPPDLEEALATIRGHASLDFESYPVERVRLVLDRALRNVPEDDRVWLALARLDLRAGRYDAAAERLAACRARRPDDPAVWRTWLDWAEATGRIAEVRRALTHLPPEHCPLERLLALRVWLAERRDDRKAHQEALEQFLERDPFQTTALERLTDLAIQNGQHERAAALRRRKAELDRARHRYGTLVLSDTGSDHLRELARLAESLGRWFEAHAFWTHLSLEQPDDAEALAALARLERQDAAAGTDEDLTPSLLLAELESRDAPAPASEPSDSDVSLRFTDEAASAGLEFVFDNGQSLMRQLPETMSGGVALLDYDGDGWMDVYVVQGGPFPPPADAPNADRLFRNNGDGTFTDVTEATGLAAFAGGYGHGVTVADYDNDGHPDLFVTRWRSYALYRNNGDGTFEDVTAHVGLDGQRDWPTSAAFADFDGDGDLDLYICHYLVWDERNPRPCRHVATGEYSYCDPRLFEALPDRLYRNDGGRFVEVTEQAGITAPDGRGLGVVAADLDGDGRIDLYVANDTTANFLYRNQGDFTFEEIGHEVGVAAGAEGGYQAGMGIALGDFDGDGRPDLTVTNFYGEGSTFYQNLGGGLFSDRTSAIGLMTASRLLLGFGIAFLDADNDGRLDLATTYGHINDFHPTFPYAMPAQLLRGGEDGRLSDVSAVAGDPWRVPRVGRGLAVGDLDNDGRLDLVILAQNEPLALFRNHTEQAGHFVTLKLEGTTSNRDAIGAVVTVEAGGRRQTGFRYGGGSYQSANDPRLHFGLGESERVEAVAVLWPSGQVDRYEDLPTDTGYHLIEGNPEPKPLQGFIIREGP